MIKGFNSLLRKINFILDSRQKMLFVVVIQCALVAAALETLGVSVIIPLVNALLNPKELMKNNIIAKLVIVLGITSEKQLVITIIIGVMILYIVKNLFFIFNSWIKVKFACKIRREVSTNMMISYIKRGYAFFTNHNYNEINQGVIGDVASLYRIMLLLMQTITQAVIIVFIVAFMCYSDWQMAVGVITVALLCLLFILLVFRKKMIDEGEKIRKYTILTNKVFMEAIYGIKEVFVLRKQKHFVDEFNSKMLKQQKATVLPVIGSEIPAYIIEGVCITGIMVVLYWKMGTIDNKEGFVAILASFAVGAFRILPAVGKISSAMNDITVYLPGLDAIYENISESRERNDLFYDIEAEDDLDFKDMHFTSSIDIKNISFAYDDNSRDVLNDLSISIDRGDSVALIGESGAGKSTLADLILGILEPSQGLITMDGVDIHRIPNAWSRTVGFVPQSIYLSDSSIRENVAFGVSEKDIDDKLVHDALNRAKILDYINSLPEGINTEIGDRGIRLSGGQRQRIGIARALYHNPEILILDEATSALDNETETAVMEAIDSLKGMVTLIIIAHRLTTIRNCNKIFEIVNGKAVPKQLDEIIK